MRIYFDFNDWWVGYYRSPNHHYVCLLPTLVIKIRRHWPPGYVARRCFACGRVAKPYEGSLYDGFRICGRCYERQLEAEHKAVSQ